jgi:phosphoserine phosphatase RsbU/P
MIKTMRILVAEDDRATRFLLCTWLESWGHEATAVEDGEQAWDRLNAQHFDIVVSDWTMPKLDGIELCRRIRSTANSFYRYVVLCTGRDRHDDVATGLEAGADDFLVKPVNPTELRARLHAAERILNLQSNLEERNRSLASVNRELTDAYQKIRRDLHAAAEMQERLLPLRLKEPDLQVDWLVLPSTILAGDTLGYFTVEGDRFLVFYHLDVSGHGVPAALLSVTLNRMLSPAIGSSRLYAREHTKGAAFIPAEVVTELNRLFQSLDDEYFTLIYGLLDLESGEVRMCQAGHPTPIRVSAAGEIAMVGEGGFPVGLWPDMRYDEVRVQLERRDRLILYSDGIVECTNADGEAFSLDRLKAVLVEHKDAPLPQLKDAVCSRLTEWNGSSDFGDDVSMLMVEWG